MGASKSKAQPRSRLFGPPEPLDTVAISSCCMRSMLGGHATLIELRMWGWMWFMRCKGRGQNHSILWPPNKQ